MDEQQDQPKTRMSSTLEGEAFAPVMRGWYIGRVESTLFKRGQNYPHVPYIEVSFRLEGKDPEGKDVTNKPIRDNLMIGGITKVKDDGTGGDPMPTNRLAEFLSVSGAEWTCGSFDSQDQFIPDSGCMTTFTKPMEKITDGPMKGKYRCPSCKRPREESEKFEFSYVPSQWTGLRVRLFATVKPDPNGEDRNNIARYLSVNEQVPARRAA